MPAELDYLWVPLLACLVLTGIHAYLGIHVLSRGVIFVDLALAQIAALGSVIALWAGLEPGSTGSWLFALGFTMLGALVFSVTRLRRSEVPQEAIIGITFAVASAAAIVVMSLTDDVHGVERIQAVLLGRSIVWVSGETVLKTALVYAAVASVHVLFRRQLLLVSTDPGRARAEGLSLGLWDFVFYASFGFVITSSVQIAGVLLVFSFLIVPAVIGTLCAGRLLHRLLIGWTSGILASVTGLLLSWELPSGPVIILCFGVLLCLTWATRHLVLAEHWGRALVRIAGVAAAAAGLTLAVVLPDYRGPEPLPGVGKRLDAAELRRDILAGLRSEESREREQALAAARAHPDPSLLEPLYSAFRRETEPDLRIHMVEEGLRLHDERFLAGLVEILLSVDSPFYRQEAAHLLSRYSDLELPEEITDRELARIRTWWEENGAELHWDEGKHRFVTTR
ncbi:MAG: metal ABC transporter permease [Planctomycetota bacterium]